MQVPGPLGQPRCQPPQAAKEVEVRPGRQLPSSCHPPDSSSSSCQRLSRSRSSSKDITYDHAAGAGRWGQACGRAMQQRRRREGLQARMSPVPAPRRALAVGARTPCPALPASLHPSHLRPHDRRARLERHHVAHARLGLPQHRHQRGDLDDRVCVSLREVALAPRALNVKGQDAHGRQAAPLACGPGPGGAVRVGPPGREGGGGRGRASGRCQLREDADPPWRRSVLDALCCCVCQAAGRRMGGSCPLAPAGRCARSPSGAWLMMLLWCTWASIWQ